MIPFPYQQAGAGLVSLTAAPVGPIDPHWDKVAALLHFDGADGGAVFDDETGRVWTAHGAVHTETEVYKFGGASGRFQGGGITTGASSAFNFGKGNFCIEFWYRRVGSERGYIFSVNGNDSALIITPSGEVEVYGPSSWVLNGGSTPFPVGTFEHCALERVGNQWTFYRNGAVYLTATDVRSWGAVGTVEIGSYFGSMAMIADVDEFRVTKGVARYNGPFTPPVTAFPRG